MLLARHRKHGGYYAVKVLQKQMIVKRREVNDLKLFTYPSPGASVCPLMSLSFHCVLLAAEACDGWEERTVEGTPASVPRGAPFLLPDTKHALFCPWLCKWRGGMCSKIKFYVSCTTRWMFEKEKKHTVLYFNQLLQIILNFNTAKTNWISKIFSSRRLQDDSLHILLPGGRLLTMTLNTLLHILLMSELEHPKRDKAYKLWMRAWHSICVFSAFLPPSEGGVFSRTQGCVLCCRDGHGTGLPPLSGHRLQVHTLKQEVLGKSLFPFVSACPLLIFLPAYDLNMIHTESCMETAAEL